METSKKKERCQSGRSYLTRNQMYRKRYRGFESLPLRVLNFTRTRVKFFLPIRRQSTLQTASRGTAHLTRFVFSLRVPRLPAPKMGQHQREWMLVKDGSTPKRVDFSERRRIEPRPSICNFRSFYNRKPFVVLVSFSCGSLPLSRSFS